MKRRLGDAAVEVALGDEMGRPSRGQVTDRPPRPSSEDHLHDEGTLVLKPSSKRMARAFDVAVAVVGIVLSSPLLVLSAVAIRATSRGPALFCQTRIGLHGRAFTVFKLRTMRVGNDDAGHREMCRREIEHPDLPAGTSDGIYKLEHDDRVTPVGRVLRRISVDELPQLLNVLRGDMAVVGPRPLLPWEFELCSEHHRQRSLVKPGLTGLWQVSGRNRMSMGRMLDLDLEYIQRRSWALDLRILARTAGVLIRGDGAR